jgi:hypothetical protein
VPLFENRTTIFEVEQVLTQRVRAEFIGRGRYKVVPEATGADAVLTGEIIDISIVPAGFTSDRQASRYVFTVTTRLEFRDLKTDTVLWENESMTFSEEYEVETTASSNTVDPASFFGQDSAALERMTTNFARAVVSAIMEAF